MELRKVYFRVGNETLVGLSCGSAPLQQPRILFIHGAGQATKEKFLPIAERLNEHGLPSFCFDFSGHGESTGTLQNSSLKKRTQEAEAALQYLDNSVKIAICAFSMGGHIALELLKTKRLKSLILFCPAIYAPEAFELPFDERFSNVIRQENSWKRAEVVNSLEVFDGSLLIFWGSEDKIIPKDIIDYLDGRAKSVSNKEIIVFPKVGHELWNYIYNSRLYMDFVIERILRFAS